MQSTPVRAALLTSAALVASLAIGCAHSSGTGTPAQANADASMAGNGSMSASTTQSPPPTVTSDRALPTSATGTDTARSMGNAGTTGSQGYSRSTAAPMSDEPAPRSDRH